MEQINETEEQAQSNGYQKAYEELMARGGFTPRKAKRYLDSIAKRNLKKFMNKRSTLDLNK